MNMLVGQLPLRVNECANMWVIHLGCNPFHLMSISIHVSRIDSGSAVTLIKMKKVMKVNLV